MQRNTVRINLEVSADIRDRLVNLTAALGNTSYAETFKKMLSLLEEAHKIKKGGGTIIFRDRNGDETKVLLL